MAKCAIRVAKIKQNLRTAKRFGEKKGNKNLEIEKKKRTFASALQ